MPSESPQVHQSALVEHSVTLGQRVRVGPGCIVRGEVTIGDDCELISNVAIQGPATIGARTRIYPFACIGFEPQDYKFSPGSPTAGVRIGSDCLIREHATVHQASKTAHPTTVGDRCFLMVGAHVGHDGIVGNDVILVNSTLLAGHVHVADRVIFSGHTSLHQFCRVGRLAMVTGGVACAMDLPPFCLMGTRNVVVGLNVVGMRRCGIPREEISLMRKVFREVYSHRVPREEMIANLEPYARNSAAITEFRDFFVNKGSRSIAPARFIAADEIDAVDAVQA